MYPFYGLWWYHTQALGLNVCKFVLFIFKYEYENIHVINSLKRLITQLLLKYLRKSLRLSGLSPKFQILTLKIWETTEYKTLGKLLWMWEPKLNTSSDNWTSYVQLRDYRQAKYNLKATHFAI